jgi:DNA-3-methyladenine glycosylase I
MGEQKGPAAPPSAPPDVPPPDAAPDAAPANRWASRTVTIGPDGVVRCGWGVEGDPLYRAYHDEEWGRPSREERHLFEMLILEGAQAGLSWSTILKKREGYRRAFAGFDPEVVAGFGDADVARLLADPGIVRNRLKVESAVSNARAVMVLREAGESLVEVLWAFVGDAPRDRRAANLGELPAETAESQAMSRELKRRGFRFVGPTVCYAFMQAAGLVNDHVVGCAAGDAIRRA